MTVDERVGVLLAKLELLPSPFFLFVALNAIDEVVELLEYPFATRKPLLIDCGGTC